MGLMNIVKRRATTNRASVGSSRRVHGTKHVQLGAVLSVILLAGLPGCRQLTSSQPPALLTVEPIRISELRDEGGPARRASTRLVLDGLEYDSGGDARRALARYERALQVDGNNPYAYLAIARHDIDRHNPQRALVYLDKAGALLKQEGDISPRVDVQLTGLRGNALYMIAGRREESMNYSHRARVLAPEVWGDDVLSADELL